jgi:periplasmic protein TonB
MTIAMTASRPSDFGEALIMSKAVEFWSRAWAPITSFMLHGAVLAAVLWALQDPVPNPANTANTAMPLVAMEFVAPPAPAPAPTTPEAPAAAEQPIAEPVVEAIAPPPSDVVNDAPPVVENAIAEVPMPSPPAPKPKPKFEQKSEPKPQAKPVKVPAKPQPAKVQPTQVAASEEDAVAAPSAAPGPSAAAQQQAAMPVVALKAEIAPPADYVGLLRQQLERNKVYPRNAQQRRQQGSAMLRIAINRGGQVLSFKIERSSGFELLDREVVAMVQRASPLPPIPAGLNTDRLEVVVPVEFFLR